MKKNNIRIFYAFLINKIKSFLFDVNGVDVDHTLYYRIQKDENNVFLIHNLNKKMK